MNKAPLRNLIVCNGAMGCEDVLLDKVRHAKIVIDERPLDHKSRDLFKGQTKFSTWMCLPKDAELMWVESIVEEDSNGNGGVEPAMLGCLVEGWPATDDVPVMLSFHTFLSSAYLMKLSGNMPFCIQHIGPIAHGENLFKTTRDFSQAFEMMLRNNRDHFGEKDTDEFIELAEHFSGLATKLAVDVMVLLECKNIWMEPREEKERGRIAVKRHPDQGPAHPAYTYNVMKVRPAHAPVDHPGVEIGTMSRHTCREHIKYYGPQYGKGLLFGKLAGAFLIPEHDRGFSGEDLSEGEEGHP